MGLRIKFKIVTPEKTVHEDSIFQATLPIVGGEVTILPSHRSYIGVLKAGEIVFKKNEKDEEGIIVAVSGGFVEFNGNTLTVLADVAERVEELDIEKIKEAKERAEKIKNERIAMDENEYAKVLSEIERSSAWIKAAEKYRRRKI